MAVGLLLEDGDRYDVDHIPEEVEWRSAPDTSCGLVWDPKSSKGMLLLIGNLERE